MKTRILPLMMILLLITGAMTACGEKQTAPEPISNEIETEAQQASEVSQEEINKANALAMRDYLAQYIDLSTYTEEEENSYDCVLTLTPNAAIEHKLDTIIPEVELPDFKNLRYGMQLKEMEDGGFYAISDNVEVEAQVGVPASLTVRESPLVTIDLMVYNPLTAPNAKMECVIDSYRVPVENGPVFLYNGITGESTLEDILETFGAPDPEIQIIASEYEYTLDKGDKLRFRLFYDNRDADHTQTEIDLVYDENSGTAAFSRLAVYEND